jgi:glutamate/aspartate transport system substrate-binding protein
MKIFRIAFVAAALCAMTAPASSDELYGTLKKVRDTKTFTIGFREASFPFAYYDDEKKPVGFSVELCNRIADALKQQFNLPDLAVRYLPINAQTRIPLLTNGTIDIECVTQLKLTPKYVVVKDHAEGLLAVETGRADAYAHDEVGAYSLISKSPRKDGFDVVGRLLSFDPYGLMIRRDDSAFKLVVNRTLAMIFRSGEVYEMYKRHFDPFGIPLTPAVDWNFKLNSMPD